MKGDARLDITGILLATIAFMYLFSGPRGKSKYYPLAYGLLIVTLAVVYGAGNREPVYYALAAATLAKALWMFRRWGS